MGWVLICSQRLLSHVLIHLLFYSHMFSSFALFSRICLLYSQESVYHAEFPSNDTTVNPFYAVILFLGWQKTVLKQ